MKIKTLVILSIFIIIAFISINSFSTSTYSNYKKEFNVDVNTHSEDIICNVEIDNPNTYISKDGWAYFKVIVKNYDEDNNITKVPIKYNVAVTNEKESNASYRYLDSFGNKNDFSKELITQDYTFKADEKKEQTINIEVKTNSMKSEQVNFKVDVNCYQTEK